MRKSLTRVERLKKKAEFSRVFEKPDIKADCRGARLVARRNGLVYNRFAATLTRRYGNSVKRNYARRVLKEIYRKNKQSLSVGYDFVVVLYPGDFSYREREQQFMDLFRRVSFGGMRS